MGRTVTPSFLGTVPAAIATRVRLGMRGAVDARALSDVSTPLSTRAETIRRACRSPVPTKLAASPRGSSPPSADLFLAKSERSKRSAVHVERLTAHRAGCLGAGVSWFDVLIKMKNIFRIVASLDLYQAIIVRSVSRSDPVALLFGHEIYVSAAGGVRRAGVKKSARPLDAAHILRRAVRSRWSGEVPKSLERILIW